MNIENRKRFSLRKMSVGLVSAIIGTVCLSFQSRPVLANEQQTHKVNYQYVSEDELTEAEKQLIVNELPKFDQKEESTYYLVYRPNKATSPLPSTGSDGSLLLSSAAVLFIVVGIAVGKHSKRKVTSLLLVTVLGSSVISPSALALSSHALATYNQTLAVSDPENIPTPLDIPNYRYIGYIKLDQSQPLLPRPNEPQPKDQEEEAGGQTTSQIEMVPFDTVYASDDTMPYGQTQEVQAGQNGEKAITMNADSTEVVGETLTKASVPRIVAVGTKPVITVEELPYREQRIEDDTLEQGQEVVERSGENGTKTTTVTYTLNQQTGQVTQSEPVITEEPAVDRVVRVGTKIKEIETRAEIPFSILYESDDTVSPGQTKDLQIGQNGEKVIVRRADTHELIRETLTKAPVPHIVAVGTQPRVTTEEIPYNERRITDDTLEQGQEVVEQPGQNGLKTTTITYSLNEQTGQVTQNEPVVTEEPAVDKVVRVGSKIREVETRTVLPFETVYSADDTLALGQTRETQSGQNGEKLTVTQADTGAVIRETVTKAPVTRQVIVGTQPTVLTEVVPYSEQRIEDDTLEQGQEVVERSGENGTKTITTTYTVDAQTGQVIPNNPTTALQPPIDKVIKVGTKAKQKPTVTVATVTKNEAGKSVSMTFTLSNPSQTYQSAKVKLYKGDVLVRDMAITDINAPLTIEQLEYFTPYTLKTEVTYDLGNGVQSEVQQSTDVELEYKKIEFKDISGVELYKKVGETYQLQSTPQLTPENIRTHFIKVLSTNGKPLWLPIADSKEEEKNGVPVYKVRVDLPELVQDEQGEYKENTVFYLPKSGQTSGQLNNYRVDYTTVPNATAERTIAYSNTEKLLPFYNKEYLVHMGNQISPSQKLYQTNLRDVVPMINHQPIMDIHTNKTAINRLLLHYDDNTIEYVDIAYKGDFKNNRIAEYTIAGTSLLYTPEVLVDDYAAIVDAVLPTLSAIELDSQAIRQTLNIQENDPRKSIHDLYLDSAFQTVKANLGEELRKVLSTDAAINISEGAVKEALIEKIKANATPFLLGLTYLNKWYNINYDAVNVKDLSAYKLDFFGNQAVSTIDHIIRLGTSGFDLLKASNNVQAFDRIIGPSKHQRTLFEYVENYRQLFLPTKSNNEWLKENSKAYIVETVSGINEARQKQDAAYGQRNNRYSVGVYDTITSDKWFHRNMLLPLLTLPDESVFVISNIAGVSFGGYERYKNATPLTGDEFKAYVRERVNTAANWQRDYFDVWYNILDDASKDKLFATILTYDGFNYSNGPRSWSWRTLHDKDDSIQGFFGPVGRYYPNNGLGAYATGVIIHFVADRVLDKFGSQIFTHEMTHNLDGKAFLNNLQRREGLGAEFFAYGLLEAPERNASIIGINTMFTEPVDHEDRYHAANPLERYQSMADVDQYITRMFDVIYTLDYLEAHSLLKQSNDVKKKWLRVIENKYMIDKDGQQTHASNKIRRLSDDEVQNIQTLNDLVEHNIINRRSYYDEAELARNSYYTISMLSPIYAALANDKGAPGDIMFKRMAFELWAAKGYKNGFLPYASNQYGQEALDSGSRTWSNWSKRYVGLVTDSLIFDKVFNNKYHSWSEFKQAMYAERIGKASLLKPITIQYELGIASSKKEVTITSVEQLQDLMDAAMARDVSNIDRTTSHAPASWVHFLKSKIYKAYLRQTDDFRTSIYK
ncbi:MULTISPECIES: ZmpA/ZmpB/ZmpC family metallo-endopeptidase [unclassified Streptococcus]|uniref:ZmpA/ZmpB/ZmpC family metallo-endopeptidase n=1 Tax=unclassified Streptococcus TaxID=2608887 RepID=UPI0010722935|nr:MULTISPECIES: ZmpA/ZmpB/ZmpC family metallo-endopeptidase [unclassified Streptococcus]MBF0787825.1 G5 domain-containing protein [Streptococcus sp. 19428wC2_LYSM12]MCQ9211181.1 G5 domain-containing protein [Streptococcus sp. B01]MCQ9214456.1 G5 domain-containing protein [Streptococcus sp. O1]TFV05148.1 YSIRK-type signal peptide-containing protein [Streptococcus sp. LYSM12]